MFSKGITEAVVKYLMNNGIAIIIVAFMMFIGYQYMQIQFKLMETPRGITRPVFDGPIPVIVVGSDSTREVVVKVRFRIEHEKKKEVN